MNVNLLAINIGNTRTQLGTFIEGELQACEVVDNQAPDRVMAQAIVDGYAPVKHLKSSIVLLASVNPHVDERIAAQVIERLHVTAVRVEDDIAIPIGRQLDPETLVGDDRLLNAAAAFDVLKQACVIVDAGTAVTVDLVDGAGTFHGGAISPGAQMMLDSLHRYTALLPEVKFEAPQEAIGHNTAEAMKTAVFHGIRGMVRELVELFAEEIGAYPVVVATGGDAQELFEDYELIERIVPELTLLGMALTFQTALRGED